MTSENADVTNRSLSDECPVCGQPALVEVRCKVICTNCRTIVKSCADLAT
jgi:hypothetical protein